jgi:hypothetical protein
MKIPDINLFRKNKEELLRSINKRGVDSLSVFCACTGLPVIIGCMFIKEDMPQFNLEMDRKILILKEFYDYED